MHVIFSKMLEQIVDLLKHFLFQAIDYISISKSFEILQKRDFYIRLQTLYTIKNQKCNKNLKRSYKAQ